MNTALYKRLLDLSERTGISVSRLVEQGAELRAGELEAQLGQPEPKRARKVAR